MFTTVGLLAVIYHYLNRWILQDSSSHDMSEASGWIEDFNRMNLQ